jgi:hypothetical protein
MGGISVGGLRSAVSDFVCLNFGLAEVGKVVVVVVVMCCERDDVDADMLNMD